MPLPYYDRAGRPITTEQWCVLYEQVDADGRPYLRVAEERLGDVWVSTVWLGLDHNWGDGPPLIFETMIFPECEYCERAATEAAALAAHDQAVTHVRSGAYAAEMRDAAES